MNTKIVMKTFTNLTEQRVRNSISFKESKSMTDQSAKKQTDINSIMANYAKTGLLPVQQEKVARYIDNTQIMPLEQAHELVRDAMNLFEELPAQIRKLMDNKPENMVNFIKDPDNKDILIKYNVLEKPKVKTNLEPIPKEKVEKPKAEPAVVEPKTK